MKLAVVVQRYGADISGGAELHARYIAERLAKHAEVEVAHDVRARLRDAGVTSCRRATRHVNGVPVRRFPVARAAQHRSSSAVARSSCSSSRIRSPTSCAGSKARDPTSPALIDHIVRVGVGVRLLPVLQLPLLPRLARRPRGAGQGRARADGRAGSGHRPRRSSVRCSGACARIMYNSLRGARDDQRRDAQRHVPGVVVGVGSDIPERTQPARFRKKYQHQPAVRDLHRPHRRQQGVQRALRLTFSAMR